ncbi:DUF2793 domain-containing protein [Martelella soudanensis]|uniref:DUF2793 domain-containing protein n=1 Tax=unclassified Martelella TaxID=2629616 RepID=UPI0015DF25A4|nr:MULTISPECIES: DUF2793 domain-containing protein [unclassified Martelella]
MSDATSKLGLPFILPAQAQKHVTHNEALQRLDAIVHLLIVGEDATPPETPADGVCHLVGASPGGLFAGHAGDIAIYQDGLWQFVAPAAGWSAWFGSDEAWRIFDGSGWVTPPAPNEAVFAMVGINATADATNRLSVVAPATLLNNAGAGHQLKINKATPADTASLLFQTGWSGRAEMGLAGTDGFAIKISPDGSSWFEALRVAPSGAVIMPERPLARVALAAGSTLIDTPTALGFDTLYTGQGGFSLGSVVSGGGLTLLFPVSGYYAITLNVAASASDAFSVTLEKNASENVVIVRGGATGGTEVTLSAIAVGYFAAGDDARLAFTGEATYNLGYGATEVVAMLV